MFASSVFIQCARYSTIGFVGLGNMGRPMALNLARRNPVLAYDSNVRTRRGLQVGSGELRLVKHQEDVCSADVLVTMLPSSRACLDVYCGPEGLARSVRADVRMIDRSKVTLGDSLYRVHSLISVSNR